MRASLRHSRKLRRATPTDRVIVGTGRGLREKSIDRFFHPEQRRSFLAHLPAHPASTVIETIQHIRALIAAVIRVVWEVFLRQIKNQQAHRHPGDVVRHCTHTLFSAPPQFESEHPTRCNRDTLIGGRGTSRKVHRDLQVFRLPKHQGANATGNGAQADNPPASRSTENGTS
jgi:hypothetical protein